MRAIGPASKTNWTAPSGSGAAADRLAVGVVDVLLQWDAAAREPSVKIGIARRLGHLGAVGDAGGAVELRPLQWDGLRRIEVRPLQTDVGGPDGGRLLGVPQRGDVVSPLIHDGAHARLRTVGAEPT